MKRLSFKIFSKFKEKFFILSEVKFLPVFYFALSLTVDTSGKRLYFCEVSVNSDKTQYSLKHFKELQKCYSIDSERNACLKSLSYSSGENNVLRLNF